MSHYKLEFTLRQHTPLIHFQGEQLGATLRATELKPKLDRFLIEKLGLTEVGSNGNIVPKQEYKHWFIGEGKQHLALNYKVNIESDLSPKEIVEKKDPLYFGGMGSDKDTLSALNTRAFKVHFFSFSAGLFNALEKYFEAFLANHNFGTRQSKGYGSFYLEGHPFDASLIPFKAYHFTLQNADKWKSQVKLFYQLLRQGINMPRGQNNCPETSFYAKPAIFLYAKENNMTWDKKAIKSSLFLRSIENDIACRGEKDVLSFEGENAYLLRDLFGLSSEERWHSYGRTLKKEHPAIKRFKSPITFKPIMHSDNSCTVYFWANDSLNQDTMLNKTFTIRVGNNRMELSTPQSFSIEDFFAFAFTKSMNAYVADQTMHQHPNYLNLSSILSELRTQVSGGAS
jgi:hypothetical protein